MDEWKGKRDLINEDENPDVVCEVKFDGKQRRFKMFALVGFEDGNEPLCVTVLSLTDLYFAIESLQKLYTESMSKATIEEQLKTLSDIVNETRKPSEDSKLEPFAEDDLDMLYEKLDDDEFEELLGAGLIDNDEEEDEEEDE